MRIQGTGSEEREARDKKRERGFTLTELLVVIVILGVLASVVVFSVGGVTNRGNQSACDADRSTVETAQETYFAQNNAYAANVNALVTARLLRRTSRYYSTNNTGAVTAIPGNSAGCT